MGTIQIDGSTPKLTIGNATAEDATILFDGNAQDFYIALDDTADDLLIGLGSTVGTTPAIAIDENLKVNIPVTTASTSASTGSLTTGGGAGIGADLYVGDDVYLITDSAVLGFGADKDTTLTHTDGTGLTLNSTNKLCFNDASQYIQGASNAILDIAATDEIELTATLVDVNANLDVSGTYTGAGLMTTGGNIVIPNAGNIGSASDTDAIAIASNGVTTFSQAPVFPDGSLALADLDIDGGTEIGAAIVDADLFIIDDGAGGTNRKCLASRLKTYAGGSTLAGIDDQTSSNDDQLTITDTEVTINEDSDQVTFRVETDDKTHMLYVMANRIGINEDAPDAQEGLTINQGGGDDECLSMKSGDVAHGMTDQGETDTFCSFLKQTATTGGVLLKTFSEDTNAWTHEAFFTNENTTKSASGVGVWHLRAREKSGTSGGSLTSNANIMCVRNDGSTKFIVDAEGDLHADGSATTVYDEYDDAQLIRACDLSKGKGVIDSKFDKFIAYNHEHLADLKLVGREEDGTPNHFINVTGMQRLHNGAIWQQYEKHNQLLEAVYDLAKEAVGEDKANAILDKHEVKRLQ